METTHMSISGQMDKQMWYIHSMGNYSSIKKNKVVIHGITWAKLENSHRISHIIII